MRETDEDRSAFLEVQSAGHIHIGFLPECSKNVLGGVLRAEGDPSDLYPGIIQLELD